MDNFVAIDFETANFTQSSICSVGIVIAHAIDFTAAIIVIVRYRTNERIEVIYYLAVFNNDYSDRTDA